MENFDPDKDEEPPQQVLFRLMNHFANVSSEDGSKIALKEGKDFSVIPEEAEDLAEELTLMREILVRQEQMYNEEVKKYDKEIENLELELRQSELRVKELKEKNYEGGRKEQELQFKKVVEEYEKTVAQLVAEKTSDEVAWAEEEHKLTEELRREHDALEEVEKRFTDLLMLYEAQKQQKQQVEQSRGQLECKIEDMLSQIQMKRNAFETLEQHAKSQIERANRELDAKRQNYQVECARLKGISKKLDLKIESLEGMIQQKSRENQELTAIYDECLSKLDPNSALGQNSFSKKE